MVVAMHAVSSKPPSCGASQEQSCQCTASWLEAGKIDGLHLQAVAEHVSSLAIIAGNVLPAHAFGAASADFRQGVRRATWVGPAWMSKPYREQVQPPAWHACSFGTGERAALTAPVSGCRRRLTQKVLLMQAEEPFTSFGHLKGAVSAQRLQKPADYPADALYASDSEEVRCMQERMHHVPRTPCGMFLYHVACLLTGSL